MPDGFKVADGFVEVTAKLDRSEIIRAARAVGDEIGDSLDRNLGEAGTRSGASFGSGLESSARERIRDSRGRFLSETDRIGDEGGKRSGRKWGDGIGSGILNSVTMAAGRSGGILTSGLSGVGPAAPVIGGVIVGSFAAAAPVAGAMLGGALLAGVATAGIGIGLATTIREPAVQAAFVGLKNDASEQMSGIAEDWTPTMLGAIASIRGQVPGIGSELRSALLPARGYVEPLVQGLTGLVRGIMPGFRDILAESAPIVAVLRSGMTEFGTAIGSTFSDLSQYSDEFASGLQAAFKVAAMLVSVGGNILTWLAQAYRTTLDWAVTFSGFMSKIPGVGDAFKGWNAELLQLQATANGSAPALTNVNTGLTGMASGAANAAAANAELANRNRILNGTFGQAIEAGKDLAGVFDLLNGKAMSAEEATLNYEEALDKATASIKQNGRTTDENTAKGRANRSALLDLAKAGQQRAQAQYDQTVATKGTSAAEGVAQRSYAASRSALIRTAQQMGMSRGEAVRYADRIMAIPKTWNTNVKANAAQANSTIASVKRNLKSIPDEVVNIAMRVTGTKNASAAAAAIRKNMATGGPVIGPGPKGIDSELRLLAPGEHVLTDREVDAMGGHAAVEAFRRGLRGTRSTAPSSDAYRDTAPAPASAGGGDVVYQFAAGSIVLDTSKIKSLQDIIDLIEGIMGTARSRYARVATAPGR